MRFRIHVILSGILLLMVPFVLYAQGPFSIQVSAPEIFKNDVLQVEYTIDNGDAISNFEAPIFRGWAIRSGPMVTQQHTVINGQSSRKTSYMYSLAPEKAGVLEIPSTTVVNAGKKLSCKAVQIKVFNKDNPSQVHSPPPSSPQLQSLFGEDLEQASFAQSPVLKGGDNPATIIRSNSFIKVSSSKKRVYVGEPVMVTYRLYTALPSNPIAGKPPYFKGCSVSEIPFEQQFETEKINGKTFRVATIRKVQLIPLEAGMLSLGEQTIQNEVTFKMADQQFRSQAYKLMLKNDPASIEVAALPASAPASFTGVVGSFAITAQPKQASVPAQENNTLVITISGKGNLERIIDAPDVSWPTGIEHYEAATKDDINKQVFPFEGYRSFEIPFVGSKPGNIDVKPVVFSYFDPEKQQYQTIHSDSIQLVFTKASPHDYRKDPGYQEDRTTRRYIWIVPALALLVTGILYVNSKQEKKKKANAIIAAAAAPVTVAKTDFNAAVEQLVHVEDQRIFFNKCKTILHDAMAESVHLPVSTGTDQLLKALASRTSHDNELAVQCRQFLTDCDHALYTPSDETPPKKQVLVTLQQLIYSLC